MTYGTFWRGRKQRKYPAAGLKGGKKRSPFAAPLVWGKESAST